MIGASTALTISGRRHSLPLKKERGKYLALREAGVSPDALRLLIVSYPRRRTIHAVLAVHLDEEWLLLDNLTMVMVNSLEATQYRPLIALDSHAITTVAAGSRGTGGPGSDSEHFRPPQGHA